MSRLGLDYYDPPAKPGSNLLIKEPSPLDPSEPSRLISGSHVRPNYEMGQVLLLLMHSTRTSRSAQCFLQPL